MSFGTQLNSCCSDLYGEVRGGINNYQFLLLPGTYPLLPVKSTIKVQNMVNKVWGQQKVLTHP